MVKAAMVWNLEIVSTLGAGAHIGTHALAAVPGVPLDVLCWGNDATPPAALFDYDILIVNLFPGMRHVEQIKAFHPASIVVVLPDAYFDETFLQKYPDLERSFLAQLSNADVIGYVSESNRRFYTAWGKPMVHVPLPIGDAAFLAECRRVPKERWIIACDHSPRLVDTSISNVAALAGIQRATGFDVIYTNPGSMTREYAAHFGLRAEFLPYQMFGDYLRLAARAWLGVDLYTRHGYGRNELACSAVGTPCVGSTYTHINGGAKSDPWDVQGAVTAAIELITNEHLREETIETGFQMVETDHSFVVMPAKVEALLSEITMRMSCQPSINACP